MATLQNRARVYNEARNLAEKYRVEYDLNEGEVILKNVFLPEGWSPRHAKGILIDIPSTYPSEMPELYLPSDLSYEGSQPHILLPTTRPGYYRFCLHDVEWRPDRHGLASLLRLLMHSMRNPHDSVRFPNDN